MWNGDGGFAAHRHLDSLIERQVVMSAAMAVGSTAVVPLVQQLVHEAVLFGICTFDELFPISLKAAL